MKRNPGLHDAIKVYCRETLGMIESRFGAVLPQERGDEWFLSFFRLEDELKRLDSYTSADHALLADPAVARHLDTLVGTSQAQTRVDTESILRSILFRMLEGQEKAVFDEGQFERVYAEVEDYFWRDTERLQLIAPLQHFKMESDRIELESNFALVKLSGDGIQVIKREFERFASFVGGVPLTGFEKFALELHLEVPRVIGDARPGVSAPSEVAGEAFGEALSALRLFKLGSVGFSFVRSTRVGWSPTMGIQGHWRHEGEARRGPQYELSADEGSAFASFWVDFRAARRRKRPRVTLALRRYNFAYGRLRPEDRLIDYAIALEALFLKGGEAQELKYRLALRGAFLLEKGSKGRLETHVLLSRAYEERSNVVHGGDVPAQVSLAGETLSFHTFVDRVGGAVRVAIRAFLMRDENETEVIDSLDKHVIRGD